MLLIISLYAINYNYKVATSQIDLGKIFTQSVNSLMEYTDSNSKILVTSYSFYEEPIREAKILLDHYGETRNLIGIKSEITNSDMDDTVLALYGYTMEDYEKIKNDCKPQIGDYILINRNIRNFRGDIRGVNPAMDNIDTKTLFQALGVKAELMDKTILERNWLSFSTSNFKQSVMCGYELWKVTDVGNIITGIYADGWSGKEVCISDYNMDSNLRVYIGAFASSWSGDTENSIQVWIDNRMVGEIQINEEGKSINFNDYITAENYKDGNIIKLIVTKTDFPSRYGGNDDRELGAIMDIEIQ